MAAGQHLAEESRSSLVVGSRALRSVLVAFLFLVAPPALLSAIITAILLHLLGILSFQHWGPWQWILAPSQFVVLSYPLLLFGTGLVAAGLHSDPMSLTTPFIALAFGVFSGLVVAWFPDPAIAEVSKAARATYALLLGLFFAAWGYVLAPRVGAA